MRHGARDSNTGASHEQIEAAAKRNFDKVTAGRVTPLYLGDYRQAWIDSYALNASYLVPPTERIVSVDDLKALLDGWDGAMSEFGGDDGSMDHIRALIGGE